MNRPITFRKVLMSDAETVFRWRNDPSIVVKGLLQREVSWNEHVKWLHETVQSDDSLMFILEQEKRPVGQVRFNRETDAAAEISTYMASGHEGQGLGVTGIRKGCWEAFSQWPIAHVVARVRQENEPAKRAFAKAGFKTCSESEPSDVVEYLYDRPADVPHNRLTFGKEEVAVVSDVVLSGQWAGGRVVKDFEQALADVSGRRAAVCVGSGLGALRLGLLALGVGDGDEVIVPGYSCVALANAVLAIGAIPRPANVISGDWNLDPTHVKSILSRKTRAIIAVHTFGTPAAVDVLMEFGVPVIEDCAHTLGVSKSGRPIGSIGSLSITSFYATKLLSAGEGGAVITDDNKQADFVRQWRNYVDQPACGLRLNDMMTNVHAALGLAQLRRLDSMINARRKAAERYLDLLGWVYERIGGFNLPENHSERVWYRFAVEMTCCLATELVEDLWAIGVVAEKPIYNWLSPEQMQECPDAHRAFNRVVSLPLYPTLTEDEQGRVCHAFEAAVTGRGK